MAVKRSAVGTTECLLIYFFSTEMMNRKEKRCNAAPIKAHRCIKLGVFKVRMSDRNTANKL
jgi:hypothetical protein